MTTFVTSPAPESSKLYAHVVLDRSGSMQSCASDAVGGYNAYAAKLPETARVSLTLFDSEGVDLIRDAVAPAVAGMRADEYVPRAATPLYDAIGRTIADAEKRCAGFDRVALVILTDGHENASREFTREDILKLLTRKQEQDGWLVIYLGANQDAWEVGQKFGSSSPNTMSFDAMNASVVMASAADATNRYVASRNEQLGRREAEFSKEERERARARREG